ncbi:MAG: N utilization substance protein B [Pirellulaceae bacterium]|jgi:N utilization substance protein B
MPRRSRAREVVLQVLYADDANPDRSLTDSDQFLQGRLKNAVELVEFARSLLAGVRRNRGELDEMLNHCADNWSLSRMAVTDRNVLRLGGYEIVFTETPNAVVINEAVDLAKRFGAKHSGKFVNGILDKLAQSQRAANGDSTSDPAPNA